MKKFVCMFVVLVLAMSMVLGCSRDSESTLSSLSEDTAISDSDVMNEEETAFTDAESEVEETETVPETTNDDIEEIVFEGIDDRIEETMAEITQEEQKEDRRTYSDSLGRIDGKEYTIEEAEEAAKAMWLKSKNELMIRSNVLFTGVDVLVNETLIYSFLPRYVAGAYGIYYDDDGAYYDVFLWGVLEEGDDVIFEAVWMHRGFVAVQRYSEDEIEEIIGTVEVTSEGYLASLLRGELKKATKYPTAVAGDPGSDWWDRRLMEYDYIKLVEFIIIAAKTD